MKYESIPVAYSYEHGDLTLPRLKDLVSGTPDTEKWIIVAYLEMVPCCELASTRTLIDEINPSRISGYGYIHDDGTYYWTDQFIYYVKNYNISVPDRFRDYILENYNFRIKRHKLLNLSDCVEIHNNPYLGYRYSMKVNKGGWVFYHNNLDCKDGAVLKIKCDNAAYIINPIMQKLFCYDSDKRGYPMIDGYHWKLSFYRGEKTLGEVEGWSGENEWRYDQFKHVVEVASKYIHVDLGIKFMK